MFKDYQDIIEAVCARFENVISPLDVLAWLDNFEETDKKKALIVLNNFEYFSIKDIIKEFNNGLLSILKDLSAISNIHLIPLGKIGKSGGAMAYYLKKTPTFNSIKEIEYVERNSFATLTDGCHIVIVDDFAGTGNSIIEFYNQIKTNLPENHTVHALTIVYMEKAKINLEKNNIRVVGNKRMPAFASRGSVFGYYPKMVAIRDFCFRYGNMLYPEQRYKEKKTAQHPLGYLNTQALIGFDHSIPNNTLPILWADCKIKGKNEYWIPLFPRRGNLLIDKSRKFKQSQYYWVNIVFKLGLNETLFEIKDKYSNDTIQLISMIYLKKRRKNPLTICQILGLSLSEYDSILEKGKNKNLFDSDANLTEQAIRIFEEIQKKYRFQKEIINDKLMIQEDILYIPKKFRGSS